MHDRFLRGFVGELSLVSPAAARSGQSSEIVADGALLCSDSSVVGVD